MNYVKKIVINILIRNRCLCFIQNRLLKFVLKKTQTEILRRSTLDIFNYKELSNPLSRYFSEIVFDNNFFGIGHSLKEYCGLASSLNAYIEHGYFFGSYVPEDEEKWFVSNIISFSKQRKKYIMERASKNVILIGPYIHYAEDFIDNSNFSELKKKYGKVLLVFPSHAATGASVEFDINKMIDNIESIRKEFDTVIISLFWSDAQNNERVELYEKMGYKIFCAGHRYDPYFLSRQKSIIKLADMTMSNDIGTHIGYCIYLEKPHWIARQKVYEVVLDNTGARNVSAHSDEETKLSDKERDEVARAFCEYSQAITENQRKVINKYWGLEEIKSSEELKALLMR